MIGDDLRPPDDAEDVQRILAELTTLQLVRVFIDRLAKDLPTPGSGIGQRGQYDVPVGPAGQEPLRELEDVEAIASSMFAYVLETVFATLEDAEKAIMARQLRDQIMANHVRSGAAQPPSDKP